MTHFCHILCPKFCRFSNKLYICAPTIRHLLMEQFVGAIYFVPCIICLIWTFIYFFRVKTSTQKMMLVMLLLAVFYFTTYAFYIMPWTDYRMMAKLDMFNVPVILLLLVVDLVYLWSHQSRKLLESRLHLLLYVPALVVTSLHFLIYYMTGYREIARFAEALDHYGAYPPGFAEPQYLLYYRFNVYVLSAVMILFFLLIAYSCIKLSWRHGYRLGDGFRFFFCANVSNPIRVVCFLNMATILLLVPMLPVGDIGRSYLINHPVVGCSLTLLLSIVLFCLFYVEYMIDIPHFTLSSLSHVDIVGPKTAGKPAAVDASTEEPDAVVTTPSVPVRSEEQVRIEAALRKAFDEDRVYLDPNLSLISLSSHLSTNRTTLSMIIGQVYGVSFRQLVARYRIDAAKSYMLKKPEAKQDEVAMECGFVTAQAFNQKFKELVGEAPRMWMVKQGK